MAIEFNARHGVSVGSTPIKVINNTGQYIGPIPALDAKANLSGAAFTGPVTGNSFNISFEAGGLKLNAGSRDHVYLQFFARTASPSTRTAFLGTAAVGSADLSMGNEIQDGHIRLITTGAGKVMVNSQEVWHGGNFTPSNYLLASRLQTPTSLDSTDLRTLNYEGVYFAEAKATCTNTPLATTAGAFVQFADAGGNDVKFQMFCPSTGGDLYFQNAWGATGWKGWQKVLTTGNFEAPLDGKSYARKNAAWVEVTGGSSSLPPMTGNAGKALTTDGTTASWSRNLSPYTPATGHTNPESWTFSATDQYTNLLQGGFTTSSDWIPKWYISAGGDSRFRNITCDGGISISDPSGTTEIWRPSVVPTADTTLTLPDRTGVLALEDQSSLIKMVPPVAGKAGLFLQTDGTTIQWAAAGGGSGLPPMTGNATKVLTTDGTTASWTWDLTASKISLPVQANDLPATPAGTGALYAKNVAGRVMPKWQSPSGVDYALQASLAFQRVTIVFAVGAGSTATTASLVFGGNTQYAGGVNATFNGVTTTGSTPPVLNITQSTAALNNCAFYSLAYADFLRGTATFGGFFCMFRLRSTTLGLTGVRTWVGMTSQITTSLQAMIQSGSLNAPGFVFNCLGGTDTTLKITTYGTASATVDTGIAISSISSGWLEFIFFMKPGDSVLYWRLREFLSGTVYGEGSINFPTLPASSTLRPLCSVVTASGSNKGAISLHKIYIETDN